MAQTVLVVEDDAKMVNLLRLYLEREGYGVVTAADGRAALEVADRARPSLVILDLMLPHLDGYEVCKRLRAVADVPILMLTARVDEVDKLLGLQLGADDYVTKPFSPREVVARVQAILRRSGRERRERVLRHRDLEMDVERHRATAAGGGGPPTPLGFKILYAFLWAPGRACSP